MYAAAYFSSAEGVSLLGGSGGMPPQEILKIIDAWKCYFQRFPDSTWAL